MENRFVRYSQLYVLLFILFLSIVTGIAVVFFAFWGFGKLILSKPGDLVYASFIVSFLPAVFIAIYTVFYKRTASHPSSIVKIISRIIFIAALLISVAVIVASFSKFVATNSRAIEDYWSCSLTYAAGNVATIFIIAIVQAFTTKKEEDWMEKRRRLHNDV
ncbi:MAG: hypothetical protein JST86_17500 [Bacteroidetes bacterium]|nr:hypothetical protein [Bacteroidota bacterium]